MHNLNTKKSHALLSRGFFSEDTAVVARKLLGKILVRKFHGKILSGIIVETEAYYGEKDPASRAYKGVNKISKLMFEEPGKLLVYVVHANALVNVIAHRKGKVGAILIRSVEPLDGVEQMLGHRRKHNHKISQLKELCSGPGRLTQALKITTDHNGADVTNSESEIIVIEGAKETFKIGRSHRIGVTRDLKRKLRFFISDNPFVSR